MQSKLCYLGDIPIPENWRAIVSQKTKDGSDWLYSKEAIPRDKVFATPIIRNEDNTTVSVIGGSDVDWHKSKSASGFVYSTLLILEADHTLVVQEKDNTTNEEELYAGLMLRFDLTNEHKVGYNYGCHSLVKSPLNFYALSYDGKCLSYMQVLKHFDWLICT
jgi:hypothetical protein